MKEHGRREAHTFDFKASIARLMESLRTGQITLDDSHFLPNEVDTTDPVFLENVRRILQRRLERLSTKTYAAQMSDPRLEKSRTELRSGVLKEFYQAEGVTITPAMYEQAKILAEQPDEHLTPVDRHKIDMMRLVVHTIEEKIQRQAGESADATALQFQDKLLEEAIELAILERRMSLHDVTKLNRSFEITRDRFVIERERLEREVTGGRSDLVFVVAEMDVVGLKQLNDEYGIPSVDQRVFAPIGEALRGQLRDTDMANWFGGDECTVMLNCVPADKVLQTVERLHSIIAQAPFPQDGDKPIPASKVKYRIGVRVFTLEELKGLPIDDAVDFVKALRHDADIAAQAAKSAHIQTTIWTPELNAAVADKPAAILRENFRRSTGRAIDDVRKQWGEAAARDFQNGLDAVWAEMEKKYGTQ